MSCEYVPWALRRISTTLAPSKSVPAIIALVVDTYLSFEDNEVIK
jgi:hypothetical protein